MGLATPAWKTIRKGEITWSKKDGMTVSSIVAGKISDPDPHGSALILIVIG